jgi:ferritin-like protein
MEKSKKMGINRTGILVSPKDSAKMIEGAVHLTHPTEGSELELAQNRMRYLKESDGLGSLPSIHKKEFKVLLDKLGERLAFERTGVRLYDALISKYHPIAQSLEEISLETLIQFRNEEFQHFLLLAYAIQELGGDPTAETPSADLIGISSMGVQKLMVDSRTSFFESLEALLVAELSDRDGWDLLIQLTHQVGLREIAAKFQVALHEEEKHLAGVRAAVQAFTLGKRASQKKAA